MTQKIVKKRSNSIELCLPTLDKEYQDKLVNLAADGYFPGKLGNYFSKINVSYMTLDKLRNIFSTFGFEIEVTPIIDAIKTQRVGKYRWSIAVFNWLDNLAPKHYLYYSENCSERKHFSKYELALESALIYIIDNLLHVIRRGTHVLDENKYSTFKTDIANAEYNSKNNDNDMKMQKETSGNQVDDFVNDFKDALTDVKQGLKEIKQGLKEDAASFKGLVNDFNNSEFKKEMQESAKQVKDSAVNAGKKGFKFAKAMFNAGKAFTDAMKNE